MHLPVLAIEEEADYLDLITKIPGVIAALVDEAAAALEVVVSREASGLLVERQVKDALLAGHYAAVHA